MPPLSQLAGGAPRGAASHGDTSSRAGALRGTGALGLWLRLKTPVHWTLWPSYILSQAKPAPACVSALGSPDRVGWSLQPIPTAGVCLCAVATTLVSWRAGPSPSMLPLTHVCGSMA